MTKKEIKKETEAVELNNEQLDQIDGGRTIFVTKTIVKKKTNFWGKTKKKVKTYVLPIEIDD